MTTNKMLGKVRSPWCPICKAKPGIDCVDIGKTTRQMKRVEKRRWKRAMWWV